jgi:hypothetical protein
MRNLSTDPSFYPQSRLIFYLYFTVLTKDWGYQKEMDQWALLALVLMGRDVDRFCDHLKS